ncbi:Metallo-hydrolase/oxidoreductase [Westerdykella ornata]|uniref:Metallo-hydrolase/oxidoreductase n=1 Tax=Westerdykella ornata TaxID=318751 RepID=A0A6A6JLR5_WESOR|nr:Metallo-hydrolase/oxidoreductase [Westerdykella ornata]KAF2276596.1 Metallo-hydrolase/oxidoreductase [Westerdykella ornata]
MSSQSPQIVTLPAPVRNQTYVTVAALDAGHLTLPERLFVTDADPEKRTTVPSMSFLIQHPSSTSSKTTNILFDLGLKRDFSGYRPAQQHHISQRQPTIVSPDAAESLQKGGLSPQDIDTVILSHVHWDHVGTPSDFPSATFIAGSGTLHLLAHGGGPLYPAELFNADELPVDRTRELPPVRPADAKYASAQQTPASLQWRPLAGFPAVIDFFSDGSVYIVDAPGHLYGHVNLLCRIGEDKWVYLGGDCCHDPRILTGEKGIAEYDDGKGGVRSVHVDTCEAARTVERVRRLMGEKKVVGEDGRDVQVEIVVAHDKVWRERNKERFFPGNL